ncbi:MAG: glycosyltransferase family 2 protein [Actinobacteria bacterium]|nr:glycosyltransferase family 2 protein [Actinomycetota bacterium]
MAKLSIIIPCYFVEKNIPVTGKELIKNEKLFPRGTKFEYIFVDDGSKDKTFDELVKFKAKYPKKVKVIKLARNFGSNNASLCGISRATGDCCSILAADLQDPPELIAKMFKYWEQGIKLIIANRMKREDPLINNIFSNIYHKLMKRFVLNNAPNGGFDLCLFDKQIKEDIIKMEEKNTYIPYLLMWLGYDYISIPYDRRKREIGVSKWTLSKKIKAFIDSFVSFTYLPVRFMSILGIFLSLIAITYSIMIIYGRLINKVHVEGWSSLMIILLFVSSFEMISLGIIGEYLWRTLDSSRKRPNYIIDKLMD